MNLRLRKEFTYQFLNPNPGSFGGNLEGSKASADAEEDNTRKNDPLHMDRLCGFTAKYLLVELRLFLISGAKGRRRGHSVGKSPLASLCLPLLASNHDNL